jgi:hypothetical protein
MYTSVCMLPVLCPQLKAWCYYESRLLGAHHGLISSYALEVLVLYIFNLHHAELHTPLDVRAAAAPTCWYCLYCLYFAVVYLHAAALLCLGSPGCVASRLLDAGAVTGAAALPVGAGLV